MKVEDFDNLPEMSVEPEGEGTETITIPFNPGLIRIRRDPFTLGELVDKIEHKEVNFQTSFQRKDDLWDNVKQSRLIESLLLRLPLPAFYFDEQKNDEDLYDAGVWNVIDGLQRCSVFSHFIVKKDRNLENLEFLSKFNGFGYDQLPRGLQRQIMQTPLTVYVVEGGTPEEVKFNIFKRINTGGLVLTAQEIRHAMNPGIPADFVAELANIKSFKKATCDIIKTARMEDRDFTTRFISFYLQSYENYQPDLDSFMAKGLKKLKITTLEQREAIKSDFDKAMRTAIAVFGNDAFRKRNSINDRRKPINKPLFEVLSVTFAQLTDIERKKLQENKKKFKKKFIELNNNSNFRYSISSGTSQRESVFRRFKSIKNIMNETLNA